jgi:hypothetical protein
MYWLNFIPAKPYTIFTAIWCLVIKFSFGSARDSGWEGLPVRVWIGPPQDAARGGPLRVGRVIGSPPSESDLSTRAGDNSEELPEFSHPPPLERAFVSSWADEVASLDPLPELGSSPSDMPHSKRRRMGRFRRERTSWLFPLNPPGHYSKLTDSHYRLSYLNYTCRHYWMLPYSPYPLT